MTSTAIKSLAQIMTTYNTLHANSPTSANRALTAMMRAHWAAVKGQIDVGRLGRAIIQFGLSLMTGDYTSKYITTVHTCNCPDAAYWGARCLHQIFERMHELAF